MCASIINLVIVSLKILAGIFIQMKYVKNILVTSLHVIRDILENADITENTDDANLTRANLNM